MVEQGFGWRCARARGFQWVMRVAGMAFAFVIVATAGCATTGGRLTKDSSPEAVRAAVTERVNARWAALIKGDVDMAYTFLSPATREIMSLAAYKAQARGSGFREIRIDKVNCEAEVCKVGIMLTYDHRLMKGLITPLTETWVIDQGQVWYVWQG